MKNALLIFIKNPVKGKVKTRLAQSIGDDRALEIYQQLLKHTHQVASKVDAARFVFYSDEIDHLDYWENEKFSKYLQHGNDLGEKMRNAFNLVFQSGFQSAVIVGSDCLEINEKIIHDAFNSLMNNDVCIGPAKDGGYYLLGMKKLHAELFSPRTWSQPNVFNEATKNITDLNLTYFVLPELNDIDTMDDLPLSTHNSQLSISLRYKKHVFICTNQREKGNKHCCGETSGMELVQLFKKSLKDNGLNKIMRAQRTGCLDACDYGPSVVVYPEGIFYGGVKPEDVEQIVQDHLINNKPVERLITKFEKGENGNDRTI